MDRLRIALLAMFSLLTIGTAGTVFAAAQPPACVYVEVANLPIKYAGATLNPTIPSTINGKPARMLADTGAEFVAMTHDFADKLV